MNNYVRQYLIKEYKYELNDTEMYDNIEEWETWYKNKSTLHQYYDSFGNLRYSYSLGMAKRISEDWSSITFTEKDEITTNKRQNKKFVENFIKKIKLNNEIINATEIATWSGTCGAIIRLKNIKVKKGIIEPTDKTDYDLIKVSAKNIIPLRIEHGNIIDVAFVSNCKKGNKKLLYIELHRLTDEGYIINNIYLNAETGKEEYYNDVISEMKTLSNTPLFSILRTPVLNNIDNNLGLGMSMYGNSIDQLKACDDAYNNFVMDFVLGGKKIIYNKSLIQYKSKRVKQSDGTYITKEYPVYPDDISKQQFMQVGDSLSKDELIKEYNPDLRVEDNKNGIQFALDILSFMAGLGTRYYEFNGGGVVTATQYMGDRQDLMKNAKKYRDNVDEFISGLIKAGLLLERLVFKNNVTEDCIVEVINKDGLLVSDEEIKQKYIDEIAEGLRQPWEYRVKFFGEDEETAKRMILDEEIEENTEE